MTSGEPNYDTEWDEATRTGQVSRLLRAVDRQEEGAFDALVEAVYDDLLEIARRHMRREAPGHTLDTAAVLHEAYVRLASSAEGPWEDRTHFFATASRVMRHLLVDHARKRRAKKRGDEAAQISLREELADGTGPSRIDLLALHEALEQLEAKNERMARVVECRFFGGLTVRETADALGTSVRSVERDWTRARAHLYLALYPDEGATPSS